MSSETTERYDSWRKLYESGLCIRQIHEKTGYSMTTVYYGLMRARTEFRPAKRGTSKPYREEIIRDFNANVDVHEIAAKYGVTAKNVYQTAHCERVRITNALKKDK